MSVDAPLAGILETVPELRNRRSVSELVGGLTNTNYKVETDAGAYVVRVSSKDAGLLAIDRENEYLNSVAAAEAGVGAAVVAYLPEQSVLVLEFIEGTTQTSEDLRRGDKLDLAAAACRQLHGARRFRDDFDMFDIQRRYLGIVQERGFRLPERYLEFEPQVRAIEEAMAVRDEGTVPCNNDLLAENFIDVGGAFRLIDYEYSGNNDACFELGNVWSESNLSLEQLDELVAHYYGRPSPQQGGPGPALGAHVEVRLDALGVDPGRRLRDRLRLLGVGDGEVRAGRRRVRRPWVRAPARRRAARGLSSAQAYELGDHGPVRRRARGHGYPPRPRRGAAAALLRRPPGRPCEGARSSRRARRLRRPQRPRRRC